MVEYKCDKCQKTFDKKHNYDVHANRKYSCYKNNQPVPEIYRIIPNNIKNINSVDKITQCNYCKQTFSQISSLNRHLNDRCKVKKEDIDKKEEIYQLLIKQMEESKKEMEERKKQIQMMEETNKRMLNEITELKKQIKKGTSTNNSNNGVINNIDEQNITNNNTNNQQNNIKQLNINLIAYGKEDLSFITDDQVKKILNKGFKSIENLAQIVHFDKNRPENHNIYISNIKDSYVMMYDGIDWKLMNRENCLQDIYDEKCDYLVEKFEQLEGKLDESTLKRFGNFLSRKDDDKIIEQTKREIKLILYNNRKIPEETRRLLKLNDENMLEE